MENTRSQHFGEVRIATIRLDNRNLHFMYAEATTRCTDSAYFIFRQKPIDGVPLYIISQGIPQEIRNYYVAGEVLREETRKEGKKYHDWEIELQILQAIPEELRDTYAYQKKVACDHLIWFYSVSKDKENPDIQNLMQNAYLTSTFMDLIGCGFEIDRLGIMSNIIKRQHNKAEKTEDLTPEECTQLRNRALYSLWLDLQKTPLAPYANRLLEK